MKRIGPILCLLSLFTGISANASSVDVRQSPSIQQVARVGVLAYRGVKSAKSRWKPLETYLTSSVQGWRFEFVPVTQASTISQIEDRKIDFLITNPGHYVTLQKKFHIAAIATRERLIQNSDTGLLKFGTAIFTRSDSDLHSLSEMKGRTLAAVSPDAFGGFQIAWREFTRQNIDPYQDMKSIRFMGFPQDAIITAVKNGDIDVGIVRSGLLELLAGENRIKLEDFRVIGGNAQLDYPHMVSSRLYPEWPFASMPSTGKKLSESVLAALLATQQKQVSDKYYLPDLWSVPLSYGDVRVLVSAYDKRNANSTIPVGTGFSPSQWIAITITLLLLAISLFMFLTFFTRKQQARGPAGMAGDMATTDPAAVEFLARFNSLTKREREVLCMICHGLSSKVIADELGVSTKTIEFHRANLLQKTDAGTTPHLVQLATKLGFDNDKLSASGE